MDAMMASEISCVVGVESATLVSPVRLEREVEFFGVDNQLH